MCKDLREAVQMDKIDHILIYTVFMSLYPTLALDRNAELSRPFREKGFYLRFSIHCRK